MPGIFLNFEENHIGKHYLCTLCKLLLRAPVQTVCGHRCCQSCVKERKGPADSFVCPEDGTLVTEVYPDRFVEREVLNLAVTCINQKRGCTWKGTVREYEDHLTNCPYQEVECTNEGCNVIMKQCDLQKHLETDCKFRLMKCMACGLLVPQGLLKKHQQADCQASKIKCNQCGKDVVRAQLQNHQESDCDEAVTVCPFVKIGCAAKRPLKKNDRRKHLDNASVNHITYLLNHVNELEKQIIVLKEDTSKEKDQTSKEKGQTSKEKAFTSEKSASWDITEAGKEQLQPPGAVAMIEGSTTGDSVSYINLKGHIETAGYAKKGKVVSDSCPFEFDPKNKSNLESTFMKDFMELNSRIEAVGLALEDCQNEQRFVRDMIKSIEENNRRVDALRDLIRKLENRVINLETSQQINDRNMNGQNEKLSYLEDASYNGVLIWEINNFMRQRHDAITGKATSIYSPFFYTGRYGYKMRLRVYLNGDGIGKGSHISLFFVMCKGRYDSLLSWPFKQKVTMTVLDQEHVKNVSDSFRPDPSSSSFQKPKNPMNIASGCPLFMPISLLDTHAYIRDDTLYIKVEVDTFGLL